MEPLNNNKSTIIRFLVESANRYADLDSMMYLKRGEYPSM